LHSSWQQLVRYTHLRPEQVPALPYESPPSPHQPASSSTDARSQSIRSVGTNRP
jgi:hypothetical protein